MSDRGPKWFMRRNIAPIYDPGFDGVETKSQHNNSKSSCTSNTPCLFSSNEPIPREDTPTVTPLLISSFKMFPEGVGRISMCR